MSFCMNSMADLVSDLKRKESSSSAALSLAMEVNSAVSHLQVWAERYSATSVSGVGGGCGASVSVSSGSFSVGVSSHEAGIDRSSWSMIGISGCRAGEVGSGDVFSGWGVGVAVTGVVVVVTGVVV